MKSSKKLITTLGLIKENENVYDYFKWIMIRQKWVKKWYISELLNKNGDFAFLGY